MRDERQQLDHRHVEPFAVAAHLEALGVGVEDLQRLLLEGRARWPRSPRAESIGRRLERPDGSPDARGVVADDQHHAVAGVLELAQLAQHDRVTEVDVGRGRVDPSLTRSGRPSRGGAAQLLRQRPRGQAVDGVAAELRGFLGRPRRGRSAWGQC